MKATLVCIALNLASQGYWKKVIDDPKFPKHYVLSVEANGVTREEVCVPISFLSLWLSSTGRTNGKAVAPAPATPEPAEAKPDTKSEPPAKAAPAPDPKPTKCESKEIKKTAFYPWIRPISAEGQLRTQAFINLFELRLSVIQESIDSRFDAMQDELDELRGIVIGSRQFKSGEFKGIL